MDSKKNNKLEKKSKKRVKKCADENLNFLQYLISTVQLFIFYSVTALNKNKKLSPFFLTYKRASIQKVNNKKWNHQLQCKWNLHMPPSILMHRLCRLTCVSCLFWEIFWTIKPREELFSKKKSNFLYTQNSNKIGQVIASTCCFIISTKKTQDYFLDYIFEFWFFQKNEKKKKI